MTPLEIAMDTFGESILVWFGIFTRISAACFLLPSIGEHSIPARIKLAAALSLSIIIIPMVYDPAMVIPATPMAIITMIGAEVFAGLFIGVSLRLLVFALQTAGTIAAQNMSISQMFQGAMAPEPQPIVSSLLAVVATAAALATGLHIKIILALAASYDVVPFGFFLDSADVGYWSAERGNAAFDLATGLSLPFLIIAFVYNLSLGAINRAMPQMMVAFVGAPAIAGMGIGLLMLTLPIMLTVWLDQLDAVLMSPFSANP